MILMVMLLTANFKILHIHQKNGLQKVGPIWLLQNTLQGSEHHSSRENWVIDLTNLIWLPIADFYDNSSSRLFKDCI